MKTMIRSLIVCSCIALLFVSCKSSKNDVQPQSQAPVIIGAAFTDVNAEPLDSVGVPNIRMTSSNGDIMICYPNPCISVFNINLSLKEAATIKTWIVAGMYNNAPDSAKINYQMHALPINNQSLYSKSTHLFSTDTTINTAGIYDFRYKVDSLPSGYYKLYTVVNTDTLYDNIYISEQ